MKEIRRLRIADFNISIRSKEKLAGAGIDEESNFLSKNSPDFILNISYGEAPDVHGKMLFDSEGAWALYKNLQGHILRIPSPPQKISRIVILNPSLISGALYIKKYPGLRTPLPLEHPLGQILLTLWLSKNGGITLHACGLKEKGRGILFCGSSGAGKSTMARLWSKEKGVTILSDERIVVRQHNSIFYMYGTPWRGRGKMASPDCAPLKRVFFIKPGRKNSLSPLESFIALRKALVLSYLPVWDKNGMSKTINFLAGLAESIPSYGLNFKRGREIINLVKEA